MRLSGLSPVVWLAGALVLVAGIAVLHLLRVRLRRVEVDTLLFFRLAGVVRQPRVLPGRPARLWAFLLACAAALSAWTALADPRLPPAAPSRVVIVEPARGAEMEARLLAAAQVARWGLGPRGAVLVATTTPAVLLAADEPVAALAVRAGGLTGSGLAAGGGEAAAAAALRAAADRAGPGDELVWIGAPPPAVALECPLRLLPRDPAPARLRALRWEAEPGAGAARWSLVADVESPRADGRSSARAGLRAVLRAGGQDAGAADVPAGAGRVVLGPVAAGARSVELRIESAGIVLLTVPLPDPATAPVRVHVASGLGAELERAVGGVIALDPTFVPAADAAAADVLVVGAEIDDPRPTLVLTTGVDPGPRAALATRDCPLALSLRDRARRAASALPAVPDAAGTTVWIEDTAQGRSLAEASASGGRLRVRAVGWLLEPVTHADVPLFLAGALRLLAGRPHTRLLLPGEPLRLPAIVADAPLRGMGAVALAAAGTVRLDADAPGARAIATPAGPVAVHVLDVARPDGTAAAPVADAARELAALGGIGALAPWLLLALLLLIGGDAWLFHRGRLP